MDNKRSWLGWDSDGSSLNAFVLWDGAQSGENKTDVTLQLDHPGSCFRGFITKGTKRAWAYINGVENQEHQLQALGLRQSPSSSDISKITLTTASTVSSVKEIDEESSVDIDLNVQLNLGTGSTLCHNKTSSVDPKFSHSESTFDLQLSLLTGPSESALTSVTPLSNQHQNSLETSVLVCPVSATDEEGSASSCLIFGSHLAPNLYNSYLTSSFPCDKKIFANSDAVELSYDSPSVMIHDVKSPVASSSGVSHSQHRNNSTKKCQFQGCEKGARGASGLCIAHGGGRRCQKPDCQKGAEGRTIYCKAHGGGRRCEYLGCTKSAEGRTDYCIAHGGGRRCNHEGCSRAARGKSGLCIRHGGGKRCQMENCTKSAEGYSGLCISHGGGRRCHFPECSKGAQGSTLFCKAHGGGKRCTFLGCTKGAEGSTPFCKGHGGGKRCSYQGGGVCPKSVHGGTQFCVAHGGGKRCAVEECTRSARGRTNFCVRHGGGKRCKSDGCDKSAQGSTDFCKAHGGGKRCLWGQAGSSFGAGECPCDKFARSKSGFCTSHSALVQDHCVHGGGTLGLSANQYANPVNPEKLKEVAIDAYTFSKVDNDEHNTVAHSAFDTRIFTNPPKVTPQDFLLEGRVHGGSLLALLASSTSGAGSSADTRADATEQDASHAIVHQWI